MLKKIAVRSSEPSFLVRGKGYQEAETVGHLDLEYTFGDDRLNFLNLTVGINLRKRKMPGKQINILAARPMLLCWRREGNRY